MRTLTPLILICLLLSCASKKVVQKSTVTTVTETKNDFTDTKKADKAKYTTVETVKNANEETEITVTKYDTSKPSNPIESVTTIKKKKAENKQSQLAVVATDKSTQVVVDKTATTQSTEVKSELKETPKTPAIKYWLNLAYLLCAIGVVYVIYRYWNKITNIFNTLVK